MLPSSLSVNSLYWILEWPNNSLGWYACQCCEWEESFENWTLLLVSVWMQRKLVISFEGMREKKPSRSPPTGHWKPSGLEGFNNHLCATNVGICADNYCCNSVHIFYFCMQQFIMNPHVTNVEKNVEWLNICLRTWVNPVIWYRFSIPWWRRPMTAGFVLSRGTQSRIWMMSASSRRRQLSLL